jgi:hypothetical protein
MTSHDHSDPDNHDFDAQWWEQHEPDVTARIS